MFDAVEKNVEVEVGNEGQLWVNVDGVCELRVYHTKSITINDPRTVNVDIKQLLLDAQEQIQNDLLCILDGLVKDHVLTNACQAVVDRFKPLLESVEK